MSAILRRLLVGMSVVAAASTASAQTYYQPTRPPLVTAEAEQWFRLGEPITFEGNFYYPAGPQVFFNGNTMVRTGAYRGIPLYADTTLEPYSKVFVPIAGGLLQPYERRRAGDVAGSTGSQAPSFPVTIAGEASPEPAARSEVPMAAAPPMLSRPSQLEFEERMSDEAAAVERRQGTGAPRGDVAGAAEPRPVPRGTSGVTPPRDVVEAGTKPKGLNEIYVTYAGYRWKAAGMAEPFSEQRHEKIGDYRGYPVYVLRGAGKDAKRIYLPSRAGLVAPYERVGRPVTY
ncbi:MAG TPA: hypothetical protein VK886_10750 [Vicinamibacterales bacterium]|nr:hypothetical protein [Vicinamibacterales bacterium]